MSWQLIDATESVQVYGPNLIAQTLVCTFQSFPSRSILLRVVPQSAFDASNGGPLVGSLSDAVENILHEGTATAATGNMRIDANTLLVDYVDFTVTYVPSVAVPGEITTLVSIPVQTITADTSILGGSTGFESAAELINDAYQKLAAMAHG